MQHTKENINHQIYELFPTIVYRGEITCHQEFKQKYFEELCKYWHWSEDLPREEIESPENSGRYFLHHNESYKDFFKSLDLNVRNYLKVLDVDESKMNVYVTKSWLNIHKQELPNTKIHIHNCSDISFCYYINCNETSDKLCFHQTKNNNELSEFMFQTTKSGKYNLIEKYNKYNCNNYTVTPIEGTVVLFPSSMMHSTLKNQNMMGTRVSICGDITLTVKEDYTKCEYSRVDPSLWRKI
jgi:uncharacterized protein (TIGR02466 family)